MPKRTGRKAVRVDCGKGARLGLIDEAYIVRSLSCSVDPSACMELDSEGSIVSICTEH